MWTEWLELLSAAINGLSSGLGVSEAVAIIIFTLIVRLLCLPLSLRAGIQSCKNRVAINAVQPELQRLKERYQDDTAELARQTMALYKQKGIRFFDRATLANMGAQGLFGFSMLQVLQAIGLKSSFLWIASLAKPDTVLAVVVAVLTFFIMLLMPGSSEQSNLLIFFIPAFISAFILVGFPSAIALYWLTSNIVTLAQQALLRYWFTARLSSQSG